MVPFAQATCFEYPCFEYHCQRHRLQGARATRTQALLVARRSSSFEQACGSPGIAAGRRHPETPVDVEAPIHPSSGSSAGRSTPAKHSIKVT